MAYGWLKSTNSKRGRTELLKEFVDNMKAVVRE
jgi:hypothetical protein